MAILAKIKIALWVVGIGVWYAIKFHLKYGTKAVNFLQYGIVELVKKKHINLKIGGKNFG